VAVVHLDKSWASTLPPRPVLEGLAWVRFLSLAASRRLVMMEDMTVPCVADWSGWSPVGKSQKSRHGLSAAALKLVEG
jgi:hypothetical protein